MERIIRRRRETAELGWGTFEVLDAGNDAVLAHCASWEGRSVLLLHNLSATPCSLRVPLPAGHDCADDLLDESAGPQHVTDGSLELKLEGYGYRWLRLRSADVPSAP
jgi:hypothetical protein